MVSAISVVNVTVCGQCSQRGQSDQCGQCSQSGQCGQRDQCNQCDQRGQCHRVISVISVLGIRQHVFDVYSIMCLMFTASCV